MYIYILSLSIVPKPTINQPGFSSHCSSAEHPLLLPRSLDILGWLSRATHSPRDGQPQKGVRAWELIGIYGTYMEAS